MRAVLERDFLAEVVRARTFWFRSLAALGVAAVIVGIAVDNPRSLIDNPDRAGREIFLGASFTLLGLLAVLTPPSVVGSVLDERTRDTLPLVLAAPVRPTGFALAKFLARTGTVFAWALGAAAPLAALLLLGGVDGGDLATAGLLAAGVVLEMAAWGLWISTLSRRLATASVLAYLAPALRWSLCGLLPLLVLFPPGPELRGVFPPSVHRAAGWLLASTPLPACARLASPRDYDRAVQQALTGTWPAASMTIVRTPNGPRYVRVPPPPPVAVPLEARHPAALFAAASLLAALLSVLASGARLRRESEPPRSLLRSLFRRGKGLSRLRGSPPGAGNPMAWKESRLLNTAASRPLYYGVMVLMALSVAGWILGACLSGRERDVRESCFGVVSGHACLLGLVAVVAAAASVAQEKGAGTLDLLLASRITPAEFHRGKVLGVVRGIGFLSLFSALLIGLALLLGRILPMTAAACAFVILFSVAFWTGVGYLCGLASFRTGTAVTLAGSAYGVLLVGVPLVAVLVGEGFRNDDLANALVGLWPPAANYLIPEAVWRYWSDPPYGPRFSAPINREHRSAVSWTVVLSLLALLLHLAGPRLTALRFRREKERG